MPIFELGDVEGIKSIFLGWMMIFDQIFLQGFWMLVLNCLLYFLKYCSEQEFKKVKITYADLNFSEFKLKIIKLMIEICNHCQNFF